MAAGQPDIMLTPPSPFSFIFFSFGRSGRRLVTSTASCRLHIHIGASVRLFGLTPPPPPPPDADVHWRGGEVGVGGAVPSGPAQD